MKKERRDHLYLSADPKAEPTWFWFFNQQVPAGVHEDSFVQILAELGGAHGWEMTSTEGVVLWVARECKLLSEQAAQELVPSYSIPALLGES